jgi:hypothetical protein
LRKSCVHSGDKQQTQEREQTSEFPPDNHSHASSPREREPGVPAFRPQEFDSLKAELPAFRLIPRLQISDVTPRSRNDLKVVSI